MQRWMQSKVQLAKRHGTAVSGCNRAMGGVWDDVRIGPDKAADRGFKPVCKDKKGKPPVRVVIRLTEPPVAWGKGRKARRANLAG